MSKIIDNKDNEICLKSTGSSENEENSIFSNLSIPNETNNIEQKNITTTIIDLDLNFSCEEAVDSPLFELYKNVTENKVFNSNQIENNKEKLNDTKLLKLKRKKIIDNKNVFSKREENLEDQYCKKESRVIKFAKRFRKKFKMNFYKKRKKSIKSNESNMIDFNKENYNYNQNNEVHIFPCENSNDNNSVYSISPTITTGSELNEISICEERTSSTSNIEENDQNEIFWIIYKSNLYLKNISEI